MRRRSSAYARAKFSPQKEMDLFFRLLSRALMGSERGHALRREGIFVAWCPVFEALLGLESYTLPIDTERLVQDHRWPVPCITPQRLLVPPTHAYPFKVELILTRRCDKFNCDIEVWIAELAPHGPFLHTFYPEPSPYIYQSALRAEVLFAQERLGQFTKQESDDDEPTHEIKQPLAKKSKRPSK